MRRLFGLLVLVLAATTARAQLPPPPMPDVPNLAPSGNPPLSSPGGGAGLTPPGAADTMRPAHTATGLKNPLARPAPGAAQPAEVPSSPTPPSSPAAAFEAAGQGAAQGQPPAVAPAPGGPSGPKGPPPKPAPVVARIQFTTVGLIGLFAVVFGTALYIVLTQRATTVRWRTLHEAALLATEPTELYRHAPVLVRLYAQLDTYEQKLTRSHGATVPDYVLQVIARGTLDPVFALLEARVLPEGQPALPLLRARAVEPPLDDAPADADGNTLAATDAEPSPDPDDAPSSSPR